MIRRAATPNTCVFEQQWSRSVIGNHDIRETVVVQIADRQASRRKIARKSFACARAEVGEFTGSIFEEQDRLFMLERRIDRFDQVVGMSVANDQILVAVRV